MVLDSVRRRIGYARRSNVPTTEPDTWQDALTRRLRTLIRTAPLHRIEASKSHRSDSFSDQDLRALALRTLDVVIEKMGLGSGATFEDVRVELRPLVFIADPTLDADDSDAVVDAVVLGLLNDRDRRQAFAEPYLSVSVNGASRRELQFHLLRERETPEGGTVLVATVEGINLYAGMLDYPVEDAQIAEEAVLHAQVRRGRIADAVRTAQRARLRSIEYEQKVLGLLETVRRDVDQVDWVTEVLGFLSAARDHVGERLDAERQIRRAVEERLDNVRDESALSLVSLRDTLVECINRHVGLHHRLIEANRHYLNEQERQGFRPPTAARLPDLEADVLRPAANLDTGALADLADALLARLQAPSRPAALRLSQLIDSLLAPRRNEPEDPFAVTDADLEALPLPPPEFSEGDRAAVDRLLAHATWPARLGVLISGARQAGLSRAAVHLLALRVLHAYDPSAENEHRLTVEPAGEPISAVGFRGDDLIVDRQPARSEVAR